MKPEQLSSHSFAHYHPAAQRFAVDHLALLQRLPLAICPSFLVQIQQFDSSFPAERTALEWQCNSLLHLPADKFRELTTPFAQIKVPSELQNSNWVDDPAAFVTALTAFLWSSGQINTFRDASTNLFAVIPERDDHPQRLTLVVMGQGAGTAETPVFRNLKKRGILLANLDQHQIRQQFFKAFQQHAQSSSEPYAHWYVDGGEPWEEPYATVPGAVCATYPRLGSLRSEVLRRMEQVRTRGGASAEAMRDRLAETTDKDLHADHLTSDPVLQRFYTELFTQSSGPQIFSTTFVQWTGRELARRAHPRTLLLRYAPRQTYPVFDELLKSSNEAASLDPEGSLRDADMGAWYTWIEMNRITAPGNGTFVAWREETAQAVVIARNAPAGTVCTTPLTLEQALQTFA